MKEIKTQIQNQTKKKEQLIKYKSCVYKHSYFFF